MTEVNETLVAEIVRKTLAAHPHWIGNGPAATRRNKEEIIAYAVRLALKAKPEYALMTEVNETLVAEIVRKTLAIHPKWIGSGRTATRRNKEKIIAYAVRLALGAKTQPEYALEPRKAVAEHTLLNAAGKVIHRRPKA